MAGKSQAAPGEDGGGDGQEDSALDQRVRSLEAGQESLSAKIDRILGIISGDKGDGGHAAEATEPPQQGGTPGGIAHEIRAQLDKAERERQARAKEDGRDSEVAQLKEQVRALAETEPAPPPSRRARIMGWT